MAILVADDVEQLARAVGMRTGKSADIVIKEAVEAHAAVVGVVVRSQRSSPEEIRRRVKEIAARVAALPILDHRSNDDIIGYDENGLPS